MIRNSKNKVIEEDERLVREKVNGKYMTYFEERKQIRDYNRTHNTKITRGKPVELNREND